MQRTSCVVAFSLVFAVAACDSSASKAAAPPATGAAVVSTTAATAANTTTTLPTPLPDACSLVTSADVAAGLGTAPTAPGTPTKYAAEYVTCDWTATPPGASNANSLRLAVIEKTTPEEPGFSVPTGLPDAHPVTGLGDHATMYSRSGTVSALDLIAEKGKFVISLNGQYGGAAPAESALETALVALVRKAFVTLGA